MEFTYQNSQYKYGFYFGNTADGPFLIVDTFQKDRSSWASTGFPIKNQEIVWLPINVSMLNLTPEVMKFAEHMWEMRVFW
jgi:hypothetical protein